jgi:hypothetical protein
MITPEKRILYGTKIINEWSLDDPQQYMFFKSIEIPR